MRLTRTLGSCLTALLAVGCMATAAALAAPPEYGTCAKVAGKIGAWSTAGCTKKSGASTGEYEWTPITEGQTYTLQLKPKSVAKFETIYGETMECSAATGEGSILSTGSSSLVLQFTGCHSGAFPCETFREPNGPPNPSPEGTLTFNATRTLGYLKHKKNIGAVLVIKGNEFHCNGGSFSENGREYMFNDQQGAIGPVKAGKMLAKETLKFKATNGEQEPASFEGAAAQSLHILGAPFSAQTGLTATFLQVNGTAIEINPVV